MTSVIFSNAWTKLKETVSVLLVGNEQPQFSVPVLHGKRRESVRNYLLPRATLQVALVKVVREVHVGVPLVRQYPSVAFSFEDHRKVVPIIKEKGREDTIAPDPLVKQAHVLANFPSEIRLNGLKRHDDSVSNSSGWSLVGNTNPHSAIKRRTAP